MTIMHHHSIFIILALVQVIAQDLPGQVNGRKKANMFVNARHGELL